MRKLLAPDGKKQLRMSKNKNVNLGNSYLLRTLFPLIFILECLHAELTPTKKSSDEKVID